MNCHIVGESCHRSRDVGRKDNLYGIMCYNIALDFEKCQRSSEVEQRFRKPPVVGSIPTAGSTQYLVVEPLALQ